MPNKEIFVGYTFFRPEKVKQYTSADRYDLLHPKRKVLHPLHMDSLQKEKDTLMIITNNKHIVKKYDKPFKTSSDRAIMNTKYRISKYLTSVFCGLSIDLNARNKYFCRILQLLLDKLVAIENKLKKQEKNRQTTTYIKFSYGKRTWYLGFYISCSFCSNVCAYVMLNNRKVCQNCRSKVIVTPTPSTQNTFKNYCQSKQIISKRIDVTYTKKVSMDSGTEKYKKRFKNSLKNNKNKWKLTNNGFESKSVVSKHRLKRRCDILKKHYISDKELEFLVDQVTSKSEYNMLKEDIFINHSFNSKYFLELRKKKEAAFACEDSNVAEQSISAGKNTMVDNITTNFQKLEIREQDNMVPWQEILVKIIQEYSRDDIDTQELKSKINGLDMWEIGCLYDFTFLMKNQVSCQLIEFLRCFKITEEKLLYKVLKQITGRVLLEFKVLIWEPKNKLQIKEEKRCGISGKDKKAKSNSKRTEVGVKDVDCNMLESNWNKWNDLAFHRDGYWANF
ncbi:hypothetical protein GLOIN_2v1477912 [Rhizophagus irregularis DAOM 181602=DAOM 197198]|uniref:Uncharacterized protein n=1 Tax=Rhizophagus irregularis (strain DAOM 181602 / DAOM 197198 / MUCL 43194) TaxID=747089 RepID=A0A2P4Q3P6_RHIID|nr:hypothetical protein GLOIN_2v1477912 [Rhizophagus irregularis DAOM 181602=DAOM 197198]POG72275.1 hypothetical protein GLOIN_2v1477912 [Rhizophagus irregularis DAOM 181602=DAOM 197198]|eukprot:XP_025179141.1 hypothetical protein GLOIN_2v1477912 [Rhizophagus irregularis DAOM 181602=DAOM 197198]